MLGIWWVLWWIGLDGLDGIVGWYGVLYCIMLCDVMQCDG